VSDSGAIHWEGLVAAAFRARDGSYSPYSGYRVGAALLTEDGRVFVGTNVENASYGLCLCAERSAVAAAVVGGARRFVAIAVVSPGETPASPCGMCRQVLAEFGPPFAVRCVSESGSTFDTSTDELLPFAFTPAVLDAGRDKERSTMLLGSAAPPAPTPAPASTPPARAARPSLSTLVEDDDPLRRTMIMGSTADTRPSGRSGTDRPPRSLQTTRPQGEAFVVGVALKVAAGTGEDLAKQQQAAEAAEETAAEGPKKPEGE
jgi:cytidine deaminase